MPAEERSLRRGKIRKDESTREWLCLLPEYYVRGIGTYHMRKSRNRVFWDSVMSGRKQARHRTEIVAEMGGLVPRLDLAVISFFFRSILFALSRCSVCEVHDPAGEPGAGNRHAGFGERLLETENMAWTQALANGENRQQQFPHCPKFNRASSRLNNSNVAKAVLQTGLYSVIQEIHKLNLHMHGDSAL